MSFELSWQTYAEWLVSAQGMDPQDAVNKAGKLYTTQHKKEFEVEQSEEIVKFWENREKRTDAFDTVEI